MTIRLGPWTLGRQVDGAIPVGDLFGGSREDCNPPSPAVPDLEFFAKCWGTEIDDVDRVYIESELGPGR